MASERLDVIILGASGFTGKVVVTKAVKLLENLQWGIAGRNEDRLRTVLKDVGEKLNKNLQHIPIVIADIYEEDSLLKMAERAKIIVNCCGPYRFYGAPVVTACIKAKTHHVDVSGEPQYMERMELEYNDSASENGVYVVSACGFDSIPADLGTLFFEKHFDGDVHAIESYLKFWNDKKTSGAIIHYGTWESAVYGLAHADELRELRKQLFKGSLPYNPPKQRPRPMVHKSKLVNGWCLPFMGSDKSVVARTQRYLYENEKKRPVQYQTYVQFPTFISVAITVIVSIIFGLLARYSFGRKLLLKYPKIFSLGTVSQTGPSQEQMENTNFTITFFGDGWPKGEQLAEGSDKHTSKPSKKLTTRVFCKDPGYGSTSVALLLSAVTILKETDKLPGNGGVLPPGACFAKTSLISKLCDNGFKFEVLAGNEEPEKEKTN